jgi:hypothetical protein
MWPLPEETRTATEGLQPNLMINNSRHCLDRMSAVFMDKGATATGGQLIVSGVYDKPLAAHGRCYQRLVYSLGGSKGPHTNSICVSRVDK